MMAATVRATSGLSGAAPLLRGLLFPATSTHLNATNTRRNLASAPSGDELIVERLTGDDEGIAVFGFNRPAAKNSFSRRLINMLEEALNDVRFDPSVRALIFRSTTPGIFCAGADLKERRTMKPEEVGPLVARFRAWTMTLDTLPMPTIAALDGAALGGGMELALCCDMRVASDDARLGLTETKLAIIPGGGGTQRLPRLVGPAKAKELIYTAKMVKGEEASNVRLSHLCITN